MGAAAIPIVAGVGAAAGAAGSAISGSAARKDARRSRREAEEYLETGQGYLLDARNNVLAALAPLISILQNAISANPEGRLLNDQTRDRMFQAYRGNRLGAAQDLSLQTAGRYAMPGNSVREGAFTEAQRRIAGQAAGDIANFDADLRMRQAMEVPGAAYIQPLLSLMAPESDFARLLANLWSGGAAGQFSYAGQLLGANAAGASALGSGLSGLGAGAGAFATGAGGGGGGGVG